MVRRCWLILIVGVFVLLGSVPSAAFAAPTQATRARVAIQYFAFTPKTLRIARGTTVTWTNRDIAPHTVTQTGGRLFSSRRLMEKQTFSVTFRKAGTYTYECVLHPGMEGVIRVTP